MDATMLITDDPVKRVDNMTMAWGLEARVPFLDHELVELAASMPPELKLASGGKHILKRIARGMIPDAVIDRKKGYFPMPALKYVRGDFLEFMRDILDSHASRERGLCGRRRTAPCARPRWRPRSAGGSGSCRSCRRAAVFAEVAQQAHAPAVVARTGPAGRRAWRAAGA
jgi:asparagine synthetase B (glutamine-hydrolysing)